MQQSKNNGDKHRILKWVKEFYQHLYREDATSRENNISNIEYNDEDMISEILQEKVKYVAKKMKKGKASGEDGISDSIWGSVFRHFAKFTQVTKETKALKNSIIIILHKKEIKT